MTVSQPIKRYTPQEYYAMERAASYKSDFYNGEIFAMAGGTINHSVICTNITSELHLRLKGSSCRAYESNLRLRNKLTGLRNYPDVSVYCGELELADDDESGETVTNPTVLVEVLSRTTEAYDRGFKSEQYRRIPSLKTYILVAQARPQVEIYERQPDGRWLMREVSGLGSIVPIPSVGVELPMSEIYAGVKFPENTNSEPT